MERPTLYLCDPEKNTECRKSSCVHNDNAKYKACRATTHPEFAKLDEDGTPIQMPDFLEAVRAEAEETGAL